MEDGRQDAAGQPACHRVSVHEAAERLGTTVDAIRKRVQRDTIAHDKDADGRVWIKLDADRTRHDADRDAAGQRQDSRELVEELRRQNEYLRTQLDEANTRDREQRRIIAGLTQRIPAIEAPQEARPDAPGSPEWGEAGGVGGDVPAEPQAGAQRPWWRRWFGG